MLVRRGVAVCAALELLALVASVTVGLVRAEPSMQPHPAELAVLVLPVAVLVLAVTLFAGALGAGGVRRGAELAVALLFAGTSFLGGAFVVVVTPVSGLLEQAVVVSVGLVCLAGTVLGVAAAVGVARARGRAVPRPA